MGINPTTRRRKVLPPLSPPRLRVLALIEIHTIIRHAPCARRLKPRATGAQPASAGHIGFCSQPPRPPSPLVGEGGRGMRGKHPASPRAEAGGRRGCGENRCIHADARRLKPQATGAQPASAGYIGFCSQPPCPPSPLVGEGGRGMRGKHPASPRVEAGGRRGCGGQRIGTRKTRVASANAPRVMFPATDDFRG